jgi:SAM-dependent methyltransferase
VNVEVLRQDWDELAEEDPLYAILSNDPGHRGGRWQRDAFFATGEQEVSRILVEVEALGRPARRWRALDFGCGVGRLTRALGSAFDEVVGIDVSPTMIELARAMNDDLGTLSFEANVASDLRRFEDNSFDLTLSLKVLQHVPTRMLACSYVAEFLRVTRPDGVVVFQLWTRLPLRNRLQPRRRLHGALRRAGVPRTTLRRLTLSPRGRGLAVPARTILAVVERSGGTVLRTRPDGEWGLVYILSPGGAAPA